MNEYGNAPHIEVVPSFQQACGGLQGHTEKTIGSLNLILASDKEENKEDEEKEGGGGIEAGGGGGEKEEDEDDDEDRELWGVEHPTSKLFPASSTHAEEFKYRFLVHSKLTVKLFLAHI